MLIRPKRLPYVVEGQIARGLWIIRCTYTGAIYVTSSETFAAMCLRLSSPVPLHEAVKATNAIPQGWGYPFEVVSNTGPLAETDAE